MDIITLLACILLLGLSVIQFKNKLLNPTVLFFSLWAFILFLSVLGLYGIYKPSNEAYFLILLMLVFFFVGSYLATKFSIKKLQESEFIIKPKYLIMYILIFLLILFTLIDCIIIIQNLAQGVPMSEMRRWRLGTFGVDLNPMLSRRTFAEELFRSLVLTPFETIVPPITAYFFFDPQKYKKRHLLLFLSLIVLILSSFAGGGGRLGFIYYFGCFLLSYFVFSNKSKFPHFNRKKYRKYIYAFFILGLLAAIIYTQFRTGTGNFIKQIYTYFALPPTLLSVWLPELHKISPTYGMLTFFGIHSYFFRTFQSLGIDFLVPQIYENTYQYLLNAEIFRATGYGVGNAFVTPIYYFFIDGGYIFVCIASMFFGYIVSRFYKKFVYNINVKSFTYYALIMYGVFLTFMRVQTAIPSYIISFIMVYFLLYSHKKQ